MNFKIIIEYKLENLLTVFLKKKKLDTAFVSQKKKKKKKKKLENAEITWCVRI